MSSQETLEISWQNLGCWFPHRFLVCMVKLARQNCAECCHQRCIAICYNHHHRPPPLCHLSCQLTPRCTLLTLVVFYSYSLIWKKGLWLQPLVYGGMMLPQGHHLHVCKYLQSSHIIIPTFNLKFDGKVIATGKLAGTSGQVFEDFSLSEAGHS